VYLYLELLDGVQIIRLDDADLAKYYHFGTFGKMNVNVKNVLEQYDFYDNQYLIIQNNDGNTLNFYRFVNGEFIEIPRGKYRIQIYYLHLTIYSIVLMICSLTKI
jgi:hypothetical protein